MCPKPCLNRAILSRVFSTCKLLEDHQLKIARTIFYSIPLLIHFSTYLIQMNLCSYLRLGDLFPQKWKRHLPLFGKLKNPAGFYVLLLAILKKINLFG